MAVTDYDAPRVAAEDESLEELQARVAASRSDAVDFDDAELAEAFELLSADHVDGELSVPVVPMQMDEFRCSRCFLVRHRGQRVRMSADVCRDCV